MVCYWMFDLDGCLVDTRDAVWQAYLQAGVEMPEGAWGKPVGTWCTPEQHARKNALYPGCLRTHSFPGPALGYWRAARKAGARTGILTGASRDAVNAVFNLYPELATAGVLRTGLTWQQKRGVLRPLACGVYVDDDLAVGPLIVQGTGFSFLPVGVER